MRQLLDRGLVRLLHTAGVVEVRRLRAEQADIKELGGLQRDDRERRHGCGRRSPRLFRIPVEIVARSGFGSLSNTSTEAPLQLNLVLNTSTAVYSTAPSVLPTVAVKEAR